MLGVIFLEYKGGDGLLTKNACYHWADGEIMVGVMCDMRGVTYDLFLL
jgi:hypothetical protein